MKIVVHHYRQTQFSRLTTGVKAEGEVDTQSLKQQIVLTEGILKLAPFEIRTFVVLHWSKHHNNHHRETDSLRLNIKIQQEE